jgi:hypothetical protein
MAEPFEPEYGNHVGLVVAVNDDGRTKVWVPHLTNTVYTELNENLKDISFKSFEKDLNAELRQKLLETLPWAEAAVPTFGGGTSGYVNNSTGVASVNPPLPNIIADGGKAPTTDQQLPIGATSVPKPAGTSDVNASDNPFNQSYKISGGKASNPQYIILHDTSGKDLAGGLGHYNIVVDKGVAYESVPIGTNAPHAVDYNSRSVGISLVGYEGGAVSPENKQALANAVSWVAQKYNIPASNILTHYEAEKLTSTTGLKATVSGKDSREASWKNDVLAQTGIGTGNASTYANAKDTSGGNDSAKSLNLNSDGKPDTNVAPRGTDNVKENPTLAADRQAYFKDQINSDTYARLAFLANREVGSNQTQQQAFMETVFNRAQFSGRSLNTILTENQYGFTPGATSYNQGTITSVDNILKGSNITNLATDNATNDYANNNPVADNRIKANVTGDWYKDGQIVPYGTSGAEFLYRGNGGVYNGVSYTSTAGKNANAYASANGLQQSNPSLYARTGSSGNTDPIPSRIMPHDAMAENCTQNTGSGSANGMYSRPVVGSKVWVFFHGGDVQRPVYFASTLERHGVVANYQAEPRTPIEYSNQDPAVRTA